MKSICVFVLGLCLGGAVSTVATAQINFDMGGSELAIINSSSNPLALRIIAQGLLFDETLTLTDSYTPVSGGTIPVGGNRGIEACWDVSSASGDIDEIFGTIACGLYDFVFNNNHHLYVNLIDANWGAGGNVARILVDYDGSGFDVYVKPYGGSWSSADPKSPDEEIAYWDYSGDARERTTKNDLTFTVSNGEIPPAASGVFDAELDVNATFTIDATIPYGSRLEINSFDGGSAGASATTLKFEGRARLNVEGTLEVGNENYYGEYTSFLPATSPSYPGDWGGIIGNWATAIDIDRAYIRYATQGINLDRCNDVGISNTLIYDSDGEGLYMTGTTAYIDELHATGNGNTGARIHGSTAYISNSSFSESVTASGLVVDDDAYVEARNCSMDDNRGHGVVATAYARVILDSCYINYNGWEMGTDESDAHGVYSFYNDWWTTVRHHCIVTWNYGGLATYYGKINGYYHASYGSPTDCGNRDSVALNCITDNSYNIHGNYGLFELAKIYTDPNNEPHYQGNWSTIRDPLRYQVMVNNSTAYLTRNWWNNDHMFVVVNSTVDDRGELLTDLAGCGPEDFAAPRGTTPGAYLNSYSLYRQWETLSVDSLRNYVAAQLAILPTQDANEAFRQVAERSTATGMISWLTTLIACTNRSAILLPAYRSLGAAYLATDDHANAATSFLAMTQQTNRALNSDYSSAHAMAALAMAYAGNVTDAVTSLDSLLQAFPGDRDLVMVRGMIDGQARGIVPKTPMREAAQNETAFALEEASPNPFNPITTIGYRIPEGTNVRLLVYDNLGRIVRTLVDEYIPAGYHTIAFNAADLPSGMYFYQLSAAGTLITRRMTLLK